MANFKAIAKLPVKVIEKLGPAGLTLRKYSPEILLGGGILGVVGGTVLACKATLKLPEANDILAEQCQEIHDSFVTTDEEPVNIEAYNEIVESKEYKRAMTKEYIRHGASIAKLYAPAAVATTTGIACVIASHNIQSGRIAGLAAAYSAVDTAFSEYRDRVREEVGEKKELDIYRDLQDGEIEVTKTTKDGKDKVTKKKVKTLNPEHRSPFTFIFDEANPEFTRDATYNKHFILQQENYANAKYDLQGYLYLNDVLEDLGFDTKNMPWTRVTGWVKGLGDDYIDFGVFEAYDSTKRDFINCAEPAIWLDFNVDGYIYDVLGVEAQPMATADEEYLVLTNE